MNSLFAIVTAPAAQPAAASPRQAQNSAPETGSASSFDAILQAAKNAVLKSDAAALVVPVVAVQPAPQTTLEQLLEQSQENLIALPTDREQSELIDPVASLAAPLATQTNVPTTAQLNLGAQQPIQTHSSAEVMPQVAATTQTAAPQLDDAQVTDAVMLWQQAKASTHSLAIQHMNQTQAAQRNVVADNLLLAQQTMQQSTAGAIDQVVDLTAQPAVVPQALTQASTAQAPRATMQQNTVDASADDAVVVETKPISVQQSQAALVRTMSFSHQNHDELNFAEQHDAPSEWQNVMTSSLKQAAPEKSQPFIVSSVTEQVTQKLSTLPADSQKISVELTPASLGKVEIDVVISKADDVARAAITIHAERKDTMELLQRDAKELIKTLNNMGLKTDPDNLQFSHNDNHQQHQRAFLAFNEQQMNDHSSKQPSFNLSASAAHESDDLIDALPSETHNAMLAHSQLHLGRVNVLV